MVWSNGSADKPGADASGDIAGVVVAGDVSSEGEGENQESHCFEPCSGLA